MTEISAADYLLACRAEQEGFIEPSFDTISAYKANAAMMHYSATKESDAVLQAEGMLLVDSGGQYYEGTTDITRTMVLGPITDEQKLHFTTVLRSNLNLANARFLHGCVGMNLDILARGPIWDLGLITNAAPVMASAICSMFMKRPMASVGKSWRNAGTAPYWKKAWSRPMSRVFILKAAMEFVLKTS